MHNLDAKRAKNILKVQLLTLVVIALVALLSGVDTARDVLIGGGAAAAANAIFAFWVFGRYSAREPGRIVATFYAGELVKICTVVVVFAVAMKGLEDLNPVAFFGAFFVVQVLPPLLANRVAG